MSMFCPGCGARIADGGKYCSRCGRLVGREAEPAPAPCSTPSGDLRSARFVACLVFLGLTLCVGFLPLMSVPGVGDVSLVGSAEWTARMMQYANSLGPSGNDVVSEMIAETLGPAMSAAAVAFLIGLIGCIVWLVTLVRCLRALVRVRRGWGAWWFVPAVITIAVVPAGAILSTPLSEAVVSSNSSGEAYALGMFEALGMTPLAEPTAFAWILLVAIAAFGVYVHRSALFPMVRD